MIKRSSVVTLTAAGALALGLGACSKEQADIVETALAKPIPASTLTFSVKVGDAGLVASGPYAPAATKGGLERFDFKVRGTGQGLSALDLRVRSDGRALALDYQGTTYRATQAEVRKFTDENSSEGDDDDGELKRLGLHLQDWFRDTTDSEGRLDGAEVKKVSGTLDLSKAVKDLVALSKRGSLGDDASLDELRKVDPSDVRQLDKLLTDPRIELDAAKDDGSLRRLRASMGIAKQGRFVFDLRVSDVGRTVDVQVPAQGKPLSELLEQLSGGSGSAATAAAKTATS